MYPVQLLSGRTRIPTSAFTVESINHHIGSLLQSKIQFKWFLDITYDF